MNEVIPQSVAKYNQLCSIRAKAKAEGRLWRIKHPVYGHGLYEADNQDGALKLYLREKAGIETAEKAVLDEIKKVARVVKVK